MATAARVSASSSRRFQANSPTGRLALVDGFTVSNARACLRLPTHQMPLLTHQPTQCTFLLTQDSARGAQLGVWGRGQEEGEREGEPQRRYGRGPRRGSRRSRPPPKEAKGTLGQPLCVSDVLGVALSVCTQFVFVLGSVSNLSEKETHTSQPLCVADIVGAALSVCTHSCLLWIQSVTYQKKKQTSISYIWPPCPLLENARVSHLETVNSAPHGRCRGKEW